MTRPLDLSRIPLAGLHLIEASAGTGKTYAITNLVLRMLLEDGLGIDRVLVLTFTNAATEELRERIARRLREAQGVFDGAPPHPEDRVLPSLLATQDRDQARLRLAEAVARMDEAAIHTIHGFCSRLLKDNAFESGISFEPELMTDDTELRRNAAEDLWRRRMADADAEQAAWLLASFSRGPMDLLETLRDSIGPSPPRLLPEDIDAEQIAAEAALGRLKDWYQRLCATWPDSREGVAELLSAPGLNRRTYSPKAIDEALLEIDVLAMAGRPPTQLPKRFDLLTPSRLTRGTNKGKTTPRHPFFDLCGELDPVELADTDRRRRAVFLAAARRDLITNLERAKQARRVLGYDDLLARTAQALDGPDGEILARRIRGDWPRALIDEFQDTDPLQYRIFQRVYIDSAQPTGTAPHTGLFLIGDPKQAIYAFRGADIFTYMTARRQAIENGKLWTLDTNRRSAEQLVAAVNALFERAHAPFVYDAEIPFHPVKAHAGADEAPLTIDGQSPPPMQLRWLPLDPEHCLKSGDKLSAEGARALAAADCAGRISALLAQGSAGRARIGERPLAARDIAVLVRKHHEGAEIRAALARRGIASVSIGNDSVFQTDEAHELALIIAALNDGAEPTLRTALATRALGWTASRIDALAEDELGWDALLDRMETYRQRWQARGFLAAFWQLMQGEGVASNLLRLGDGERRLTNLLHLAELAQVAAREHPGIDNLQRWLDDHRHDPPANDDTTLLRLESDAELVRIVTLHKSKGLEFPIVFLPFPWTGFRGVDKVGPIPFHADDNTACLDLGSEAIDGHYQDWQRERLAEGMRLLYVGLTRARHQCILHWGRISSSGESPAAYLLYPDPAIDGPGDRLGDRDDATLRSGLDDLLARAPDAIRIDDAAALAGEQTPAPANPPPRLAARPFAAAIRDDWRLSSFSGLAGGLERERPDYDAITEVPPETGLEQPIDLTTGAPLPLATVDPVFRFPRGIRAGHCLHALFEELDFPTATGPALTTKAEQTLLRFGLDPTWTDTAAELVSRTLDTPLADGAAPPRLRDLGRADRLTELEFHFAVNGTQPRQLGRLLSEHGYADAGLAESTLPALHGLMKGYIDLVFRHHGRYYIVDYKSNHLGNDLTNYDTPGLHRAMAQHQYRLQYLIYCVALHRWLVKRLPDYDYDRHIGGVYYLFIRGMRPDDGPTRGIVHDRPPRSLIEELDQAFHAPLNGSPSDRST